MSRYDYWGKRNAKIQQKLADKSIEDIEKQLSKYYSRSIDRVMREFELTYHKVCEAVGDGRKPTPADLYKLDKYWQMQGQIQEELQKLGNYQYNLFYKYFTDTYLDIYNALSIAGQAHYTQIDRKLAEQMINTIWCADGKSWSQRIWKNNRQLQQKLNDCLVDCVITGKKSSDLVVMLRDSFNVSYNQADRIVRTEVAHIQTSATQKRYMEYGIKEIEVLADEDERRCKICGSLHQKRFPIGGKMPIPAHPNCRCAIIPVVE